MTRKWQVTLLISALCLLLAANSALAAMQALDSTWFTVDSGAGQSSGGQYSLQGSAGQPDAGHLAGGDYTLAGGFWSGAGSAPASEKLYLPLLSR